jgi:hypothetical protein
MFNKSKKAVQICTFYKTAVDKKDDMCIAFESQIITNLHPYELHTENHTFLIKNLKDVSIASSNCSSRHEEFPQIVNQFSPK